MKPTFNNEIATVAALLRNDMAGSFVGARTAGELFAEWARLLRKIISDTLAHDSHSREGGNPEIRCTWIPDLRDASSGMTVDPIHATRIRTEGELFAERARLLRKIISDTEAVIHQNEFSSASFAVLCVLRVPFPSGRRGRKVFFVIMRGPQADVVIPQPGKRHREPRLARCGDLDVKTIFKNEIATVAALLRNDLPCRYQRELEVSEIIFVTENNLRNRSRHTSE